MASPFLELVRGFLGLFGSQAAVARDELDFDPLSLVAENLPSEPGPRGSHTLTTERGRAVVVGREPGYVDRLELRFAEPVGIDMRRRPQADPSGTRVGEDELVVQVSAAGLVVARGSAAERLMLLAPRFYTPLRRSILLGGVRVLPQRAMLPRPRGGPFALLDTVRATLSLLDELHDRPDPHDLVADAATERPGTTRRQVALQVLAELPPGRRRDELLIAFALSPLWGEAITAAEIDPELAGAWLQDHVAGATGASRLVAYRVLASLPLGPRETQALEEGLKVLEGLDRLALIDRLLRRSDGLLRTEALAALPGGLEGAPPTAFTELLGGTLDALAGRSRKALLRALFAEGTLEQLGPGLAGRVVASSLDDRPNARELARAERLVVDTIAGGHSMTRRSALTLLETDLPRPIVDELLLSRLKRWDRKDLVSAVARRLAAGRGFALLPALIGTDVSWARPQADELLDTLEQRWPDDPHATALLLWLLSGRADWDLVERTATLLGQHGDRRAVLPLREASKAFRGWRRDALTAMADAVVDRLGGTGRGGLSLSTEGGGLALAAAPGELALADGQPSGEPGER